MMVKLSSQLPTVQVPVEAPAFFAKAKAPDTDKKYEALAKELEVTRKAIQGAYDLIAALPKPEPIIQKEVELYDDTPVKKSLESVSTELGFLMEAHEKQSEQIDDQVLQKLKIVQKNMDFLQATINDHGSKLANIRQGESFQFKTVIHFLIWLLTLGFFGANKPSEGGV